jgi:pimeloyl-ACP methyl ester carboxylesterase
MPYATNGDCKLYYETFGDRGDPALLMVNGLGSQSINYKDAWCQKFAAHGLYTIRFDNRDMGLSTHFTDAATGPQGECYTVSDMARDCIAVLDAEGIDKAHIMGLSMGGMIVQTVAIEHPERLLSMTSVMSRTGEPGYGEATPRAFELLMAPPATDRESYVAQHIEGLREWGSPEFADEARWREDAEAAFDRCFDPAGTTRQFVAVRASGSRGDKLRDVRVKTLVIHGDKDTLIQPDGGRRTAELIPGARFELIEGMGHDYPPQLWDRWVDLVVTHALG